jgi:hypothetical protein
VKLFSSPIRSARVLAECGDELAAEQLLAELRSVSPNDATVVHAERLLRAQLVAKHRKGGTLHKLAGWSCLFLAIAALLTPTYWTIHYIESVWTPKDPDAPLGATFFVALGVFLLLFIYGLQYLFFRLWFWYLSALPAPERPFAEGAFALSMQLSDYEPLYSQARKRMYDDDA